MSAHETLEWGDLVQVVKGKYAGTVGVYDDDAETRSGRHRMVIVTGPIGLSGYFLVSPNQVKAATELQKERFAAEEKATVEAFHGARH